MPKSVLTTADERGQTAPVLVTADGHSPKVRSVSLGRTNSEGNAPARELLVDFDPRTVSWGGVEHSVSVLVQYWTDEHVWPAMDTWIGSDPASAFHAPWDISTTSSVDATIAAITVEVSSQSS